MQNRTLPGAIALAMSSRSFDSVSCGVALPPAFVIGPGPVAISFGLANAGILLRMHYRQKKTHKSIGRAFEADANRVPRSCIPSAPRESNGI